MLKAIHNFKHINTELGSKRIDAIFQNVSTMG